MAQRLAVSRIRLVAWQVQEEYPQLRRVQVPHLSHGPFQETLLSLFLRMASCFSVAAALQGGGHLGRRPGGWALRMSDSPSFSRSALDHGVIRGLVAISHSNVCYVV